VRFSRVFYSGILLVAFMGCGVTAPAQVDESVRITFLDVGQGDAVLIQSPEGQTALVDAGWSSPLTDLRALDVDELDLLVATHPHADHIGGMADVINSIPVRFYMDNGQTHTTATYQGLASTLQQRTDITYLIAESRSISLGSVEIEVLPLLPVTSTDFNNRSVGLVVRYGEFAAFLSGDSEIEELSFWTQQDVVPDVTVLKAAHHGSYNGFTSEFLEDAEPEVIAISVGSNTYGHPHAEALEAYTSAAETVLRTDLDGQITIVGYEDGRYEVVLGEEVTAMVQGRSVGLEVVGMRYIYE
jgi:beta-lactamase superfamily II metal-dependent hydrolase